MKYYRLIYSMQPISILLYALPTALLLSSCKEQPAQAVVFDIEVDFRDTEDPVVKEIVASEEMILNLSVQLDQLKNGFQSALSNNPSKLQNLFAKKCFIEDIVDVRERKKIHHLVDKEEWNIKNSAQPMPLVWKPFLQTVQSFESQQWGILRGHYNDKQNIFTAKLKYTASYTSKSGEKNGAKSIVHVSWNINENKEASSITAWKTESFKTIKSPGYFFTDVTKHVIKDEEIFNEMQISLHDEQIKKIFKGEDIQHITPEYPYFFPEVTVEHPGISVIDINGDGWDDFFLTRPLRPSLFFINQKNGTFKESAKNMGLQFEYDTTCSLFADFDNDGDKDVFIGRSRHPSIYLKNNGKNQFNDVSASLPYTLPYMVSSISAADINNDGLLEVYFATHNLHEGDSIPEATAPLQWVDRFLPKDKVAKFHEIYKDQHPYFNRIGPPNVLLENKGSTFTLSERNECLEIWRKSFQSCWIDFDRDGDQDLYVSNDFAKDSMFANDGNGNFKLINNEVGLTQYNFSMGATWVDHNNNGKPDLYLSCMYSKAGSRIIEKLENIDPRYKEVTAGNWLYEYSDGKMTAKTLQGQDYHDASIAGWSWGGQFIDFDNSGSESIVVANGYYTSPKEIASDIDL